MLDTEKRRNVYNDRKQETAQNKFTCDSSGEMILISLLDEHETCLIPTINMTNQ